MATLSQATQQDFEDFVDAAWAAKTAGKQALAERLDVLARKANACCTNQKYRELRRFGGRLLSWKDVPSCLL